MEQLSNLSQLSGLNCLQYMDFYKSGLTGDLSSLGSLSDLVVFNMNNNPGIYGDVCALSKAKNLRTLRLAFNPQVTGDISCLKDLNLDTFAVTGTQITGNLSDLSHMTNLKELYLGGTSVEGDIASLSKLTKFEELVISDSQEKRPKVYGDLSSLKDLKKLRRVALYNISATNCEQFTRDHPNILEGGCSQLSESPAGGPARKISKKNILNVVFTVTGLSSIALILVLMLKDRKDK
jgi:Leucine-rich repeat (LRR) protein